MKGDRLTAAARREPRLFAGRTPREAIAKVRDALGRDAVIIEQRQRDGRVEILASADFPEPAPASAAASALASVAASEPGSAAAAAAPHGATAPASAAAPEPGPAPASGPAPDAVSRRAPMVGVLCRPLTEPLCGVLRFLGAPGAGKTTTIIKLATERVLRFGNRGLLLVSTDNRRLAGSEQLALAAELLRVPCVECREDQLDAVLAEHAEKSLVLVDSAGVSPGQGAARRAAVQDVLVVPAMWQPGALRRLHAHLGGERFVGAVLTHVDQVDRLEPVLEMLADWQLPVHWVSRGPELPDDLERATPALLAELTTPAVDPARMRTTFA